MTGKQKCAILKQIRRDIAEKNDINLTIAECHHQGRCAGTCPRCESEVRALEKAIEERRRRGIQTAIAGISAGLFAAALTACVPTDADQPKPGSAVTSGTGTGTETEEPTLAGDIVPPEEEDETTWAEQTTGEIAVVETEEDEPQIDGMLEIPETDGEEEPPLAGKIAAEPEAPEEDEEEIEFAGILPVTEEENGEDVEP